MSERVLSLERIVEGLQREFEYARARTPSSGEPRRTRTARTYDDGSYPIEPAGRVGIVRGTALAGTSTTIDLAATASNENEEYKDRQIRLTGGTGKGQTNKITSYVGTSKRVSITGPFDPIPDTTTKYSVEIWYPIIFFDKHADDRQKVSRKMATNLGSRYLPPGMPVTAVEIEGDWYLMEDDGESVIIVPKTTISAATRTVRDGGDKFTPGTGDAYVYYYDETLDEIVPLLDATGAPVVKRVRNLRETSYAAKTSDNFEMQDGSLFQMQDGSLFEMQAASGTFDVIGPTTDVILAEIDRQGDVVIGDDASSNPTSTTKIARLQGTKIDAFDFGTLTPGTGTVEIWEFTNGAIADTLATETAENHALYDIPKNEFVLIHQEAGDDKWMIEAPGENVIKGFSGPDGSETLFPYDAIQIYGDRDKTVAVGNIIDVSISKAGIVLGIKIDAKGDLFNIRDDDSPQATIQATLAETLDLVSAIDETMTDKFGEFRVTADTITHHFGKVFDVIGDTGDVDIFPIETLEIKGTGSTSVAVTKAADTVTATISGTSFTFSIDGDKGGVEVINDGNTVLFEGSNLLANPVVSKRGIVTTITAIDTVEFSCDESVLQEIDLQGTAITGTEPVFVASGTRNTLNFVSNTASTVEEVGSKGWIEIKGDAASGGMEWILHEQAAGGYSFCILGDQGPTQTVLDTEAVELFGSNLTAAAAQADRGVVTVTSAGDTVTFSVDQTVHQLTALSGAGSSGTTPVPISAGTRNQLNLISGGIPTTVQEVGSTGYIEIKGDATGGVEFILHEQATAGYSFCIDGDQGPLQVISDTDTLLILGSNLTAAALQADRGIVSVASDVDTITLSVDQTVLQEFDLSGTATSGTDPVLVSAGTRNQVQLISNTASTVEEAGSKGWIQIVGGAGTIEFILHEQTTSGYSFCITGDQGTTEVVNDTDTVEILGSNLTAAGAQADRGVVSVASAGDTITLSVDQTVLQKIDLSGTATSGTDPVLVSAGTRNQVSFVANGSSGTVEEAGSKGWIEIVGGVGTVEFILHEQVSGGYSFCAAGDKGTTEVITDTNTLTFTGSNLTASSTQARRGVITTGVATDIVQFSVDETVAQEINVTGSATTGTSLIQASAGTRNRFDFVSNTSSTVEEVGGKGWLELKGDGIGGIEFILHEQATTGYSFCIDGDQGPVQIISDADTVQILGSNLTAAAAQADRGIVSVASATDTITLSVDESVLQKIDLSGTATSGTDPVLVSSGTRNQIQFVSSCTSAVEEAGSKGWIQLVGGAGTLEFILHEQAASQYEFIAAGDKGANQTISDADMLTLEGSNLTAALLRAERGIVTTGVATDKIEISVDESVMQEIALSGSAQTGDTTVLVEDGTRNRIELVSSNTPVQSTTDGYIEIKGSPGTIELILHQQSLGPALPIGAIIESHKAPILSGGKKYIDRDGAADTDWAWMDGTSNASPGSGIDRRRYFPRGSDCDTAATNTAFGRSEASAITDNDEVTINIADHTDHVHQFNTNACHDDVLPSETHFDFSTNNTKETSIQKQVGGASLTLDHTVTVDNNSALLDEDIEMLPAFKKTHYFEKVA